MYLDSSAPPAKAPANNHQRAFPLRCARATAHSVATQKNSKGVSGVMVTAPRAAKSVAFISAAAQGPAPRPGKRSSVLRASIKEPMNSETGPKSRTPSPLSPSSAVPSQMKIATMGGWSRYPGCKLRDQTQ